MGPSDSLRGQAPCCRVATETPNYIIATGIDITEREQLEKALLNISAREQRRIGQDLHDGLGQHLTGIAFMAKVHEAKLDGEALRGGWRCSEDCAAGERGDSQDARVGARFAAGCFRRAGIDVGTATLGCRGGRYLWRYRAISSANRPVLIYDDTMATHLYHIAQESVNNAIKHGHARNIQIELTAQRRPRCVGDLG